MRINAYSIYDTASGVYMRPFFLEADGQAIRAFSDMAVDAEHDIGRHPEDYSLCRIGIFDNNKGQFTPEDVLTLITGNEAVAASRKVVKMPSQGAN